MLASGASARRFACTMCGQCCNRSPEVELSEAASLADVFVFRLMFSLRTLPRALSDYARDAPQPNTSALFYQKKKLLTAQAARVSSIKLGRGSEKIEYTQYLIISALSMDAGRGSCAALNGAACGIYDRRPASCRTAPFHYSRVEGSAASYLDAFVAAPGYQCDTGDGAPVAVRDGRIVDGDIRRARDEALTLLRRDTPWHRAIVRRMKDRDWTEVGLPTTDQVQSNALEGATTTSMRIAWQIAADASLIDANECKALIAAQKAVIERELASDRWTLGDREMLAQMAMEYREALQS